MRRSVATVSAGGGCLMGPVHVKRIWARFTLMVVLGSLVSVIWFSVLGGTARAATVTSFTVQLQLVEIGQPQRAWEADGILHVRGEPLTASVSGDPEGSFLVVRDYGIDLAAGLLVYNHATFVLETSTGKWEGTATATLTRVTVVGRGTDGSILRAIFTPIDEDTAVLEGTILTP